jgi:hypothetical protein
MVKAETSSSRIVATLHDTRRNENFGVLLVDHLQTGGSLEITLEMISNNLHAGSLGLTVNDHNFLRVFLWTELIQNQVNCLTEHDTIGAEFLARSLVSVGEGSRLEALVVCFEVELVTVPSVL